MVSRGSHTYEPYVCVVGTLYPQIAEKNGGVIHPMKGWQRCDNCVELIVVKGDDVDGIIDQVCDYDKCIPRLPRLTCARGSWS
jgi:hypothetical protein